MGSYPPPPYTPPPGYDPRTQRQAMRDQARAQRDFYRAQAQQMRFHARSLRRSSILGPILLIGFGIVFLLVQSGRLSRQFAWTWFGQWWPMILVASGVVLLAEWAWDQYRLRDGVEPPYRRSIGGLVFTLMLLTVVGFAGNQVHRHINGDRWWLGLHFDPDQLDQFFGDKHESDQALDLALPPGTAIEITDPRGDVTLNGTSDDGRIHIAIHKEIYSHSDSDAEKKAQLLSPSTKVVDGAIRLNLPWVGGGRSDLIITAPPGAAATVNADHGDIHVATLSAAATLTANHGDVEISGVSGPATVHINNGDSSLTAHSLGTSLSVEGHGQDVTVSDVNGPVSISGEYFGTTHLEHVTGAIHFHTSRTDLQMGRLDGEAEISPHTDLSADQVAGSLVLTTSNRNIQLDRVAGDISVTNRNGSIDLTAAPGFGSITLADKNGSVKTILPEQAAFVIQASTTDGDISSDFSLSSQDTDSRKLLTGTVGSGGPTIRMTTTNGDIALRKGAVAPLPPAPPAPPRLVLPALPAAPAAKAKRHAAARESAAPAEPAVPAVPGSPGA